MDCNIYGILEKEAENYFYRDENQTKIAWEKFREDKKVFDIRCQKAKDPDNFGTFETLLEFILEKAESQGLLTDKREKGAFSIECSFGPRDKNYNPEIKGRRCYFRRLEDAANYLELRLHPETIESKGLFSIIGIEPLKR